MMTLVDFKALLECKKGSPAVYIYDKGAKSVHRPAPGGIAWPLEFVLTKLNKKHVISSPRKPDLSKVGRALQQWQQKLFWKWHFRGTDGPHELSAKSQIVSPYPFTPPEELSAFTSEVTNGIFESCRVAANRFHKHKHKFTNLSGVVKWGLDILVKGSYGTLPCDKDGGFCILGKTAILDMKLECLASSKYKEVLCSEVTLENAFYMYAAACQDVVEILGDDSLLRPLTSGIKYGVCAMKSKLACTIKSHKPDGEVVPRPIHCSHNNPMLPGMKWVASKIKPVLKATTCILKNSRQLLDELAGIQIPESAMFLPFDIKDFFMSGEHPELTATSASNYPVPLNRAMKVMIREILANQFVEIPGIENRLWQVEEGTGMGIMCSGELSDLAFYNMAERDFLERSNIRSKYDIIYYGRFKDDGLIITGKPDAQLMAELKTEISRRSSFFKVKFGDASLTGIDILDVSLFKGGQWKHTGVLDTCLYHKPTSLYQPLAQSSAHPSYVHFNWPKTLMSCIDQLVKNHQRNVAEKILLREKLSERLGGEHVELCLQHTKPPPKSPHRKACSTLVLPYYEQYMYAGIQKVIMLASSRHTNSMLALDNFCSSQVFVCWKLSYPRLASVLQQANLQEHERSMQWDKYIGGD